ncbi:MAG: O-antigen ligase family protein [Owenweeksia sp.]
MLLPFQPKWLPLTLGMMFFGLCWLLSVNFKEKLEVLARNKVAGLFFLYYLWVVIGSFYSPLPSEAEKDVVLKLPFVVWPLILGSILLFSAKDQRRLLRLFIVASAMSILVCFIFAFGAFVNSGNIQEFFFTSLVDYKVLPPHYLGMYLSFAYGCLLYNGLRKRYFFSRSADVLMLSVLAIGIIFISVRIQYIVFLILNSWIFFTFIYQRSGAFKAFGGLVVVLIVFGSLAWAFPGSRHRIQDTYNEIVSFKTTVNQKQTNHRKFLWTDGMEVVGENWLMGTGTGAANAALQLKLQDNDEKFWNGHDVYYLRDRNYNYHNVFLQHWATHGLIGLLIWSGKPEFYFSAFSTVFFLYSQPVVKIRKGNSTLNSVTALWRMSIDSVNILRKK